MEKEPIVCVTPSELVKWKLRYGFIHCKWPINEWDNVSAPAALALTTEKTAKLGEKVERHLDQRPNKTTVEYEKVSPCTLWTNWKATAQLLPGQV